MIRFCSYNFGEFFSLQEQAAKQLKAAPELDLEDIIAFDQIRLIMLTVHRSAQLIFKIYSAEIDCVEARLTKSRKKTSANLLQLWRSIRERMEILVAIPEEEILTLSSQEISNLLEKIAHKHKDSYGWLVIMNILGMALKNIHPLDNRLQQYVAQTISVDLMEQLKDTSRLIQNRDLNSRRPYWMKFGQCYQVSSVVRALLQVETSRIIVQKATGQILRVHENFTNFVSVFPGVYLIWKSDELRLYYEATKTTKVIASFTQERLMKVLGSYVRKIAIYILVQKHKTDNRSLLELREIVVPIDPHETVKMTLLEDDVEKTWHGIVKKDMLVMIDLNQNLIRIFKLSSLPVQASERKLYLEPAADCTDDKFNTFYEIIKNTSLYTQPKFDVSNTHLGCVIEKPLYPATGHRYCFFAVSLSVAESPAVCFEKIPENEHHAKTRIVTGFQSACIANILIRHNDHTVNMVTFKNGKFQEVYSLKPMPSIKSAFETNKLHDSNPYGTATVIFDGATQRIKIYYRHRDDAGKMNIRVKALKIIV